MFWESYLMFYSFKNFIIFHHHLLCYALLCFLTDGENGENGSTCSCVGKLSMASDWSDW